MAQPPPPTLGGFPHDKCHKPTPRRAFQPGAAPLDPFWAALGRWASPGLDAGLCGARHQGLATPWGVRQREGVKEWQEHRRFVSWLRNPGKQNNVCQLWVLEHPVQGI